jgi:hypothetical protein
MSISYYEALPIEIWCEIGLSHWAAYKVALRVNKTLNLLLRDVDIKARFATYVFNWSSLTHGWILPDGNWIRKYNFYHAGVNIYKNNKLVKTYVYNNIRDEYVDVETITRYYSSPNGYKYQEYVDWRYTIPFMIRKQHKKKVQIAKDVYEANKSTILHYHNSHDISISRDVVKYGFEWKVKCEEFFVYDKLPYKR